MDQTINSDKKISEGEVSMEKLFDEATHQVEELRIALVDRAVAVEDLHNVVLEQEKAFQEEVSGLKQEIEDLKKILEETSKARDEALSEITRRDEESMLKERLSNLSQHGLLRSEEDARNKQAAKVKIMSEEDFKSYVEDLADARNQALASLNNVSESTEKTEEEVVMVVGSDESASGNKNETLDEVLSSLAKPAEHAEAEKKEEAPLKESASTKAKIDIKRLSEGFSKMLTLNLKSDSENKEGWL